MFWGDLSKIKESLNAAAVTLSTQASETAKQYMAYKPSETDATNQDSETNSPQIQTITQAEPSQNSKVVSGDGIKKTIKKQQTTINKSEISPQKTQNQSQIKNRSSQEVQSEKQSISKKNDTNESNEQSLTTIIQLQNLIAKQDMEIKNLQAQVKFEKSTSANLQSQIKENNTTLKELTQSLQMISYMMQRPANSSLSDSQTIINLQEQNEQLRAQIDSEQNQHRQKFLDFEQQMATKQVEMLQSMEREHEAQIEQISDQLTSKQLQHFEEIAELKRLNENFITNLIENQKLKLDELELLSKERNLKCVHAVFSQTLKRLSSPTLTKLTPESTLEALISEFTKQISELVGKTDESLVNQLNTVWQSASEIFKDTEGFVKKARLDSQEWLKQRHSFDEKTKERNPLLIRLFATQLCTIFQIQQLFAAKDLEAEGLRQVRETLQQQIQRLQKEITSEKGTANKSQDYEKKITQLELEKQQQLTKMKDALSEKLASQLRLQEQEDKLKQLIIENKNFKDRILEHEQSLKKVNGELQQQKKNQNQNEEIKGKVTMYQESVNQLTNQLRARDSELFQQTQTIANLQKSLHQIQLEQQQQQDSHKAKIKEMTSVIQKNQVQWDEAQAAVVNLKELEERLQTEKMVKEKLQDQLEALILKHEEVRQQADSLIVQFQKDEDSKMFMIDRRLINNQLVQYFNPKTGYAVKTAILQAMSNMLKFSEEEKLELGLVKKQPKMGESLVSFLMGDSDL